MTVSFKRLIASVALFAITLAGTPTKTLANDGLNTERYGLVKNEKQVKVAIPTPANLNKNPFRDKTVSASLSGANIRIDQNTVSERNLAVLLMGDIGDHRAIVEKAPDTIRSIGRINIPSMDPASSSFYLGMINVGNSAINISGELYNATIDQIEIAGLAELEFAKTVTAASVGYAGPNVQNIQPINTARSTAVIRNVRSASMPRPLVERRSNPLERKSTANISIIVLDAVPVEAEIEEVDSTFQVGSSLLIDQILPTNLPEVPIEDLVNPRALSIPTFAIGHRTVSPVESYSARTMIRSAKAIVKSIIDAIEPMTGIQQARMLPKQIQSRFFQIDEIIWSSSNLMQFWNLYGVHK